VQDVLQRLRKFRDERNWGQFHNPKDLALSVSIEAGELLELFQWRPEHADIDPGLREKLASEAADVLLYLLLLCDKAGIDLITAAHTKIDVNERRFPAAASFGIAKPEDQQGKQ
jgi:NTP pyrophosphatase (non-canonical NTP hydrolase)